MRWLALGIVLALMPAASAQKKNEILLSFSGPVKSITRKEIILEPQPDNQMTFYRSGRTRFIKAGKPAKDSALPQDTVVTIQASRKLNGDLEAVIVTVNDPDQSPSK